MTDDVVHRMKTCPYLAPCRPPVKVNQLLADLHARPGSRRVRALRGAFGSRRRRASALPVPAPAPPPDTGVQPLNPKLTLEHVVCIVGLPIPADLKW